MIYLKLFLAFLEIGATSFGGGYAALPIIQDVIVGRYGWLTMTEMTDIVSISQMTPGPIAINAATFVGTKIAGIPGALVATAANILPQCALLFVIGSFLFRGRRLVWLDRALGGLRPGVVGLIGSAALSLFLSAVFLSYAPVRVDWLALAGFAVAFALRLKKCSIIKIVGLGALTGLLGGLIEWLI